jgi:hypothetical protein
MYDQVTASLIRAAPMLQGLDRDRLPEDLSQAFAEIASARLRMRSGQQVSSQALDLIIKRMQRLAFTNEALIASSPNRSNRSAAAFVAGSAHLVGFNARFVFGEKRSATYLGAQSISTDIAAMLLFLVAEATADASEIAKRVRVDKDDGLIYNLVLALTSLAKGELESVRQMVIPDVGEVEATTQAELALAALYRKILQGVVYLASEILNTDLIYVGAAKQVFQEVKDLCSATSLLNDHWISNEIGAFSGPHHLSSLLLAVATDLPSTAITGIAPPPGIQPNAWRKSMRNLANSRPYLWRNHREAISEGYLNPGISAVIGFPTGAGKSTLAELKINSTLLLEKRVIFLAPTNALVAQTSSALKRSFQNNAHISENIGDATEFSREIDGSSIQVMTPEACLAAMSVDRGAFEDVGLLVFDECHLLHAVDETRGRRALDAMLCLLSFSSIVPEADFLLLSAMMKNSDEIAAWLKNLTGRNCLSLALAWKPTRQLRGSVVYPQRQVRELSAGLTIAKKAKRTKNPSVKDKEALICRPQGLFCLQQTWATRLIRDYALLDLLDEDVQLGANKFWKLTPNSGEVAARIAASGVKSNLKTLIFFQTVKNAVSAVKKVGSIYRNATIQLNDSEISLLKVASLEMGGDSHLYATIRKNKLLSQCVVHHGLLLPEERLLCESLYGRPDGASIMAATSTVAQGMNFPSELVIIAEDSRFDEAKDKREILEAQELLNAAGRAGRAGLTANGIVLVIPGKVVEVDLNDATIGPHWNSLQKVFGQSDQCLEIDDPLTAVLDRVHANVIGAGEIDRYVIARLSGADTEGEPSAQLANVVKKSFAAFRASRLGDDAWIKTRLQSAVKLQQSQALESDFSAIEFQIASTMGISLAAVRALSFDLNDNVIKRNSTVASWLSWVFDWIASHPDMFDIIIRQELLGDLFGNVFVELSDSNERIRYALPVMKNLVLLWMNGKPLSDLEMAVGTDWDDLGTCDKARKFVLRIVPELAYFCGIPLLLHQRRLKSKGQSTDDVPSAFVQFNRCVRRGYLTYECAAYAQIMFGKHYSRREVHQKFSDLQKYLPVGANDEAWEATLSRVRQAIAYQRIADRD